MFEDELEYMDMIREAALDKKYDEEGYDICRKNGSQAILISKANSEDAGLALGSKFMSSGILVPKISETTMDIEPQKGIEVTFLIKGQILMLG